MKPSTIAIAGCGARGLDTYASMQPMFQDRMQIVAAADKKPHRLAMTKERFHLPDEMCFETVEEMVSKPKLADAMFICTLDHDHYAHALAAIEKGYHLLLEKPISPNEEECKALERAAREHGRHVMVCHVLRYSPFYQTLKQLIEGGKIGRLVNIQATEGVAFWHQAHSYVRGNWRSLDSCGAPMILAKSCHDMDIFLWLTGKHCKRVSSFGSLTHFNAANRPAGAPDRCTDGCPAAETCPYNALKIYLDKVDSGYTQWPVNVVDSQPTHQSILHALQTGPYGRCVYACDNDVVDHQIVNLDLEDDVTISFTMTGFSAINGRRINLMGTAGEIRGDMDEGIIELLPFVGEKTVIDLKAQVTDLTGHGGGDSRLLSDFLDLIAGDGQDVAALTRIDRSVESHLVAFAAEKSRLSHGECITL